MSNSSLRSSTGPLPLLNRFISLKVCLKGAPAAHLSAGLLSAGFSTNKWRLLRVFVRTSVLLRQARLISLHDTRSYTNHPCETAPKKRIRFPTIYPVLALGESNRARTICHSIPVDCWKKLRDGRFIYSRYLTTSWKVGTLVQRAMSKRRQRFFRWYSER